MDHGVDCVIGVRPHHEKAIKCLDLEIELAFVITQAIPPSILVSNKPIDRDDNRPIKPMEEPQPSEGSCAGILGKDMHVAF